MTHVLVVDDEEDIRLLTRLILEPAGYEVTEAANGLEALDVLKVVPIDLMVLDMRMAGMDGWQLMEALREKGAIQHLRVLACSAHVSADVAHRAIEGGCQGLLVKPFTGEGCLDAVRRAGVASTSVLGRMVRSVVLVGAAWLVVKSLPDIARYLRLREM